MTTTNLFFPYGDKELDYLKKKDKRLGAVIERVGHIDRAIDPDLFASVVRHIVGQQISTKAQETIWRRLNERLGAVTAEAILKTAPETMQSCGISFKKAACIRSFAERTAAGGFQIDRLSELSDEEAVKMLVDLNGIGVWTAEMLLIFTMKRPDVLSYGDLGIRRGMRMVYRRKKITKDFFKRVQKRLSPYGTTAGLYFWAVSSGAIPELTDPGNTRKKS